MWQELIAFGIVAVAFFSLGLKTYRSVLADPLSRWFLKRGRVKLGMKIRSQAKTESSCGGCSGSKGNGSCH